MFFIYLKNNEKMWRTSEIYFSNSQQGNILIKILRVLLLLFTAPLIKLQSQSSATTEVILLLLFANYFCHLFFLKKKALGKMVTTKCLLIFLCHLMSLLLFIELTRLLIHVALRVRLIFLMLKKNIKQLSKCFLIKKKS